MSGAIKHFFNTSMMGGGGVMDIIQVGTVGSLEYERIPIYEYYEYAFSGMLYPSTNIGKVGAIQKLEFYNDNNSAIQWDYNQTKIFMGHCSSPTFSTSQSEDFVSSLSPSNWTQVFGGANGQTITISAGQGWDLIDLTTDFNYNNSDYLLIKFENRQANQYNSLSTSHDWTYNTARGNESCSGRGVSTYPSSGSGWGGFPVVKLHIFG